MSLQRSEQKGRNAFFVVHLTRLLHVGQATIRAGSDIDLGTYGEWRRPLRVVLPGLCR